MLPAPVGVDNTTFFVRISSTIERIPDEAYKGVYKVDISSRQIPREQAAHIALQMVSDITNLFQPQLSMVQVYDYNGHEIGYPVPPETTSDVQCSVERVVKHPILVDATRTTEDMFIGT